MIRLSSPICRFKSLQLSLRSCSLLHNESPFLLFKDSTNWYTYLRKQPVFGSVCCNSSLVQRGAWRDRKRTVNCHRAFASRLQGLSATEKEMKSGGKDLFLWSRLYKHSGWLALRCVPCPLLPSHASEGVRSRDSPLRKVLWGLFCLNPAIVVHSDTCEFCSALIACT